MPEASAPVFRSGYCSAISVLLAGGSLSLRSAAFSSTRPPFRQGYSRNLIDIQQLMKESSLFWQRAFFIAGSVGTGFSFRLLLCYLRSVSRGLALASLGCIQQHATSLQSPSFSLLGTDRLLLQYNKSSRRSWGLWTEISK